MNTLSAQGKTRPPVQADSRGFTLVELMVSMAMGLIILLGMMLMFTSNTKVSNSMASRTERLGDLYLVSQIMQTELRNAQAGSISWASNVLTYTSQDGESAQFEYQRTSNDRLYWQRPGFASFEEVVRELDTTAGMTVSGSASGVWTVTLKSAYQDENQDVKTLDLSFKAWARN
jgi:prepilin-type N-terminal cleavage/methylation domain-containing protein